jgi:hypothetical protein
VLELLQLYASFLKIAGADAVHSKGFDVLLWALIYRLMGFGLRASSAFAPRIRPSYRTSPSIGYGGGERIGDNQRLVWTRETGLPCPAAKFGASACPSASSSKVRGSSTLRASRDGFAGRNRPLPVIQNPDYVPVDKFTALAEFDGGVVERNACEVSARCHDEQASFLALNRMHAKSVQARDYYGNEF